MQALDAQRRDELAGLEVLGGRRRVAAPAQIVRVGRLEAVDEVDLVVGRRDGGGVRLVAEVGAVGRAEPEDGPEGAAILAGSETRDVGVSYQAALFPGLGKGGVGDFVLVDRAQEDGEVIVSVWEWSALREANGEHGCVPIKGVLLRILLTLPSMECECKQ